MDSDLGLFFVKMICYKQRIATGYLDGFCLCICTNSVVVSIICVFCLLFDVIIRLFSMLTVLMLQ